MPQKINILLAEDHLTVREGIKLLLNNLPDMHVVAEAENGQRAVELSRKLKPDLVMMDISMPETNGLRATRQLRRFLPDLKILTLTRHMDDGYLQQLIKAGVNGYVLKQSAPSELVNAIRTVVAGKSYIDPSLMDKLMNRFGSPAAVGRGIVGNDLTERENEVLKLIAWGFSNKEIANRLAISVKTVEAHKANLMRKLGMSSRIDIVRFAVLQGWLKEN